MPVYILKHFDKAATIDHMKHVVSKYPMDVLGSPDVATLAVKTDEETVKRFSETYKHWDIKPQA